MEDFKNDLEVDSFIHFVYTYITDFLNAHQAFLSVCNGNGPNLIIDYDL